MRWGRTDSDGCEVGTDSFTLGTEARQEEEGGNLKGRKKMDRREGIEGREESGVDEQE
jgi:hypothetical protein